MVVLLASEDRKLRCTLSEALRAQTRHTVLEAASLREMTSLESALLDLLMFSPSFDTPEGKAARAELRRRFPQMQTVRLDETEPVSVLAFVRQVHGQVAAGAEVLPLRLGDYELRQRLRSTDSTDIYRAWQCSVNREVAVEKLRPEMRDDSEAVRMFRRMVRARAQINHPHIAAVFDAEETEDSLFYARELIRGRHLEEVAAAGKPVPQETVLQLLRSAAEAVLHLDEKNLARERLQPYHVFLGPDGLPRVANLAASAPPQDADDAADIAVIAGVAQRLVPAGQKGRELAHVIGLMKGKGPHAAKTWKAVAREARAALQRLNEARTSMLGDSRDDAAARRRRQRIAILSVLAVLGAAGGAAAIYVPRMLRTRIRDFSRMVHIPAGEFIFGENQKTSLPEFWIDKHEVTIAQYAAFLDALPHGPPGRFDHQEQPASKTTHKPRDWSAIHSAAREGGSWQGHPLTLNCPVFNVDWWDAAAYAKWKGRRLASAREWERAARGEKGLLYPWGNDFAPGRANTGEDFNENSEAGGGIDGCAWWCDVDAQPLDVSPDGVAGMAGNVAEWIQDWSPHPDFPDRRVPVFRGGHFRQNAVPSTQSWTPRETDLTRDFLGFRTVSDTAP